MIYVYHLPNNGVNQSCQNITSRNHLHEAKQVEIKSCQGPFLSIPGNSYLITNILSKYPDNICGKQ